jgi:hypothetical protein
MMYKRTLTHEQYKNLDKQEIEDVINELIKDFFEKNVPFIKFIKYEFGNYWEKIDEDIKKYPSWDHIPTSLLGLNTEILIKPDWKNWKDTTWQSDLYDELEAYTNFFRIPRMIPYLKFVEN